MTIEQIKILKEKYKIANYLKYNMAHYAGLKYFNNEILTLETEKSFSLERDTVLNYLFSYKKGYPYKLRYKFINTDMLDGLIPLEHALLGTVFIFTNKIYFEYAKPFIINGNIPVPNDTPLVISKLNVKYDTKIDPKLIESMDKILSINQNKSKIILAR